MKIVRKLCDRGRRKGNNWSNLFGGGRTGSSSKQTTKELRKKERLDDVKSAEIRDYRSDEERLLTTGVNLKRKETTKLITGNGKPWNWKRLYATPPTPSSGAFDCSTSGKSTLCHVISEGMSKRC